MLKVFAIILIWMVPFVLFNLLFADASDTLKIVFSAIWVVLYFAFPLGYLYRIVQRNKRKLETLKN